MLLGVESCVPKISFEEQIENDIENLIPSGICEKFPTGTKISNIKVGKIVDIGLNGMTDVSYKFDYEINGEIYHEESAMLYLKTGDDYKLASLGGDCDYELE